MCSSLYLQTSETLTITHLCLMLRAVMADTHKQTRAQNVRGNTVEEASARFTAAAMTKVLFFINIHATFEAFVVVEMLKI